MINLFAGGDNILPYSGNITWSAEDNAIGQDISFESLYDIPIGSVVNLWIDGKDAFMGIIITKVYGRAYISYTAIDFGYYLKNETTIQFNEIAISDAIIKLLADFDVKCQCVNIPSIINEYYIDRRLCDIIEDLLKKAKSLDGNDYGMRMQGEILEVYKIKDERIYPDIELLGDFDPEESMEQYYNKIIVINNEFEGQVLAESENTAEIAKYGLLQEIIAIQEEDTGMPKLVCENELKEKCKIQKRGSIPLLIKSGGAEIKRGKIINLNLDGFSGNFKIKSALHHLHQNKHTVNISVEEVE